ncbi:hypothetical protein ANN_01366 [Periplaneta americana]|uniref:Uncharacterized protein n=1 Tax=Periplaneta americana TaxID=6978 RepID=A0ABQ8TWR3_PERAM|nr:hypothetical protein ANN_01366 [Periplaneta americana]
MAGLCEGGNEPPSSLKAKNDVDHAWALITQRVTADFPVTLLPPSPAETNNQKVCHDVTVVSQRFEGHIGEFPILKRWRYDLVLPCPVTIAVKFGVYEEEKEFVESLAEKKLPTEGCTGRNGEREKSSEQKKISDDRRH